MESKFKVKEEVEVRMTFAMPTSPIVGGAFLAKVSKVEELPNGTFRYKLKGYSGWWPEKTLFKKGA
jgi:hypothetical protein